MNDNSEPQEKGEQKGDSGIGSDLSDVAEEFGRLTRGFVFAGLEAVSVTADAANTFVSKTKLRTDEAKEGEVDRSAAIQLASLPVDMTRAFIDTLGEYSSCPKRIVDKFNAEYEKQ